MDNKVIIRQEHTSKGTSLHQVSALYKKYKFEFGSIILDYGCGKWFDEMRLYIEDNNPGVLAFGIDPYHRTAMENLNTLNIIKNYYVNYITCCNVLNVIDSDDALMNVLGNISCLCKENTKVIFQVYQGNKSGVGAESKNDCWQRNQTTYEYLQYIEKLFMVDKVRSNFIECHKK